MYSIRLGRPVRRSIARPRGNACRARSQSNKIQRSIANSSRARLAETMSLDQYAAVPKRRQSLLCRSRLARCSCRGSQGGDAFWPQPGRGSLLSERAGHIVDAVFRAARCAPSADRVQRSHLCRQELRVGLQLGDMRRHSSDCGRLGMVP